MNKGKTFSAILALLLLTGTATALNQEYRQSYGWRNAADHSGVTWDGIQDHPDNKLTQGYKYGSITQGLIAYYKFDEGRGQYANDSALNNNGILGSNTSTGTSDPAWNTSSRIGSHSLSFDGADDLVEVNDTSALDAKNEVSISAWVKSEEDSNMKIVRKTFTYQLIILSNGTVRGLIGDGTTWSASQAADGDTDVTDGTWHHISMTHNDATNTTTVYVDGNKDSQNNQVSLDLKPNDTPLTIGALKDNSYNFNGSIDSVRIYDRALSTKEVQKLYQRNTEQRIGPGDTLQSGLVGWWPLHETSGQIVEDLSSKNRDGILGTNTSSDEYDPKLGYAGVGGSKSALFNGRNTTIKVKNFKNIQSSFTISAWMKTHNDSMSGQRIFADDANNTGGYALSYGDPGTGALRFYSRNMSQVSLDTDKGVIEEDKWYHVAAVANLKEDTRSIYVNGKLEAHLADDNGTWGIDTGPETIGGEWKTGENYNAFNGKLQDVRVYGRPLSKSAITRLYEQGAGRYATPPGDKEGGVAYWSFDNNDGDRVVEDEWGNHDGVLGNTSDFTQPSYTDGKIGKALEFDANQTVNVEDVWNGEGDISISIWAKFESNQSQWFISSKELAPHARFLVMYNHFGNKNIRWGSKCSQCSEWQSFTSESNISKHVWTHITVKRDVSESTGSIYINGRLDNKSKFQKGDINNNDKLVIGGSNNRKALMNGTLDEVKIYSRELNSQEIHELYQHGTFGRDMRQLTRDEGLVGYWSLDEDSGQKAYDLSGHGNHGTLGSSNSSDSSDPTQGVDGVLGTSGYDFETNNTYVKINNSRPYSGSFTFSTWIKKRDRDLGWNNIFGHDYWDNNRGWVLTLDTNGIPNTGNYNHLLFTGPEFGGDKVAINLSNRNLLDNEWHMISATHNRNNTTTLFIDGEKVGESNTDFHMSSLKPVIGARHNNNGSGIVGSLVGSLDEVRIYNRSLTPSEVQSLYSTSQRGELTTRSNFRDPTRAGIRGGVFSPANGSISARMVGSPDAIGGFSELNTAELSGGKEVFTFDWNRTHSVFDTSIVFNNDNVSTSAGTVKGFAVNISRYVESFTRQFRDGVFSSTEADTADEVKLGSGYQPGGSLVAYYNFNGEDRTVEDRSGNGNTGVLSGSSIEFDGVNDTINLSESPVFDQSLEFTINAWVKSNGNGINTVLWHGKNQSGTVTENLAYALYTENGDLKLHISDGSKDEVAVANANLDAGRWHMVTGKLSSEALKLYIDGKLVDTNNREVSPQTGGETLIGSKGLDSGDWYFKGHIDEPRLYNTSLSKFEIKDIYQGESVPGEDEGLVMHQSFREGPGECKINISSSGNGCLKGETGNKINGTPRNFELNTYNRSGSGWSHETGEATQMTGKKGIRQTKSYRFDGSDDYVQISGIKYSQKGQIDEITVCSWVKSKGPEKGKEGQFIASFDRSEYWRLSLNSEFSSSNNTVGWDLTNSSGTTSDLFTAKNYSYGSWHHICGLYDSTGSKQKIIVDGEVKAKKNLSNFGKVGTGITRYGMVGGGSEASFSQEFGSLRDATHAGASFNGKLDEFRIYYDALDLKRIRSIYNPSPGLFTSSFFDAGKKISWDSFSWSEDLNSGNIEGRVQTASEVKKTSEYSEWVEGSSSFSGPTEGLVGYWRFENTNPNGVRDWSGNGNTGTLNGGVDTYAEGFRPQSNAYSFDGKDDKIDLQVSDYAEGNSPYTMSTWFKVENPKNNQIIYSYGVDGNNRIEIFIDDNTGKIGFYSERGGNGGYIASHDGKTKTWYHASLTFNGSLHKAYLNGRMIGTLNESSSMSTANADKTVGVQAIGSNRNLFEGVIDEVRLYSRSLSTQEIKSLYTSGSYTSEWIKASNVNWAQWKQTQKGTDLKPMAQWRFDSGSGQVAVDSAGKNQNGTLGGSTSSESSDPTWKEDCRYKGCLEFDKGDYINVGDTLDLSGQDVTFSAWFKPNKTTTTHYILDKNNGYTFAPDLGGVKKDDALWLGLYGNAYTSNTLNWKNNTWYHVAVSFQNNSATATFYRDGENVGTESSSVRIDSTTSDLVIGAHQNDWTDGQIDDIRIYNQSLSTSSIKALYNAPSQSWASTSLQVRSRESDPESDSLVASYSFEGVGQTVMDASGNGNSGTLGPNASDSSSDPQRVSGYSGQALDFDKSQKFVEIEDSSSISPTDEVTVSGWIQFKENDLEHTKLIAKGGKEAYYNYADYGLETGGGSWTDNVLFHIQGVDTLIGPELSSRWKHYTGTYNGSVMRLYVNGKIVASNKSATGNIDDSSNALYMGSGWADYFNGSIDEVRVYSEGLSKSKIKDIYRISKFSSTTRDFTGSSLSVNNSGEYYQFKLNSLTGSSGGVPEVESVSLANVSGWSAWTSQSDVGLDMQNNQYVQAQFNLSSGDARSTPVLESFGFGVPREPVSLNSRPVVSEGSPDDTNVYYRDGELSVRVGDADGQSLSGRFLNASSGGVIDSFSLDGNGSVSAVWNDLVRDAVYRWRVVVSDGVSTTSESYNFSTYDVNLTWTDNSSMESGFRVYSNLSGSFERIGQVPANSESFLDSGSELGPGRYVCYRVRAYNSAGESPPVETCIDTDGLKS
ncbi:MAG: LamG-like jellyroll fold domain-containing protein [Candidatus Nanohalobium sp.]